MKARWRRQLISVFLLCLILMALPAGAQGQKEKGPKRRERSVTLDYDGTQQVGVVTPVVRAGYVWVAEYALPAGKKDRFLSIQTNDATGQPAYVTLSYSAEDPDGEEVCGTTEEPIKITPKSVIYVWIWHGMCPDGTPAPATTGTITATFSNLP